MKICGKFIIFLFLAYLPTIHASSNVMTEIDWVGKRGNGNVIIKFKDPIDESGCTNKEIEILNSNPSSSSFLSIAMTAYTSNTGVHIKSDSCSSSGIPTITGNGYIILTPKF